MSIAKESPKTSSKASSLSSSSRLSSSRHVSGASSGETRADQKDNRHAVAKDQDRPSSSSSIGTSIRIVLLLGLTIAAVQYSIHMDSSKSPLDNLIETFHPVIDTASSAWSSFSSSYLHSEHPHQQPPSNGGGGSGRTGNKKRSTSPSPAFGTPLSDLYPPSSPMYEHRMEQEAEREKAAQKQSKRQRQERQKRSRSPFEDFFGTGDSDDDDDDDDPDDPDHTSNSE
ncbi:hypothetical protein BGX34_004948, partial [Mortierella sp. NVP85]